MCRSLLLNSTSRPQQIAALCLVFCFSTILLRSKKNRCSSRAVAVIHLTALSRCTSHASSSIFPLSRHCSSVQKKESGKPWQGGVSAILGTSLNMRYSTCLVAICQHILQWSTVQSRPLQVRNVNPEKPGQRFPQAVQPILERLKQHPDMPQVAPQPNFLDCVMAPSLEIIIAS